MATSDEVRDTAIQLAERGEGTEAAVLEILSCCGDHRVSLVRARQTLAAEEDAADGASSRAVELLDLALEAGSWD